MHRLSVTVVTKDEERDLPGCLESVKFADEIVVVDSGSTDRTREIATAAGAKVYENPWPGDGPQKAFAMERTTGDWVLNLDADERCSQELAAALPSAMADAAVDGYHVAFQTWMFGKRMRFGGFQTETHPRLFRRTKARYEARKVHGGAVIEGRVKKLKAPIHHRTQVSLHEYVDKINRYSTGVARERFAAGKRFHALSVLRWPFGFLRRYVLRLGFLDGYAGLVHASLGGLYDWLKYAKLEDLEHEGQPR